MSSKTESAPSALTFCRINAGERQEELLASIREILLEGDSHTAGIFNEDYWEWQYKNLPLREAAIYVCLEEEKIAGYYHVPFYEGVIDSVKKKFGMVQDVAVSKRLRGRGVFQQLASFATEDLLKQGIDLLYTFPNEKSIHTFLKYNGYSPVHTFDAFILPVKSALVIQSKVKLIGLEKIIGAAADVFFKRSVRLKAGEKISVSTAFDDSTVEQFQKFSSRYPVHRARTKNYLIWRYAKKPASRHFVVSLTNRTETVAAAVFKNDKIFNAPALLLMDFAFDNEADFATLVHYARQHSKEISGEQAAIIFTAFCCSGFLKRKRYGFVRIPAKLNPRNLNMLVKNISAHENLVMTSSSWLATLGDWDVF